MVRKMFLTGLALVMSCCFLSAQDDVRDKRFYVSVEGGPMFNLYENAFSYVDNGKTMDLFTLQYGAAAGFDFNKAFGVRLSFSAGKDAGAANTYNTAAGGFYPYTFKDISAFADAVLDLKPSRRDFSGFRPKLYAGLGAGFSKDFTDPEHPWQGKYLTSPNAAFGFRGGFIAEYVFKSGLGVFADLRGEAFFDNFNGLEPTDADHNNRPGYAGFPFDLRAKALLGISFRF